VIQLQVLFFPNFRIQGMFLRSGTCDFFQKIPCFACVCIVHRRGIEPKQCSVFLSSRKYLFGILSLFRDGVNPMQKHNTWKSKGASLQERKRFKKPILVDTLVFKKDKKMGGFFYFPRATYLFLIAVTHPWSNSQKKTKCPSVRGSFLCEILFYRAALNLF